MGKAFSRVEQVLARLNGRVVKVIGLGGIGAAVAQALAQFLSRWAEGEIWFVDGDWYEEGNQDRVLFDRRENKAVAKVKELACLSADGPAILPVPRYVTPDCVDGLVGEGDVLFLCVDNHATRQLVSRRCEGLSDVLLFSGGNDGVENGRSGTYGNVQIYWREEGRNRTNPLTRFHPEIANPRDKRPDELSCAMTAESAPQLLFTNLAIASTMLGAFYTWLTGQLDREEVCLDIATAQMIPRKRAVV
jgi:hypothetical protein